MYAGGVVTAAAMRTANNDAWTAGASLLLSPLFCPEEAVKGRRLKPHSDYSYAGVGGSGYHHPDG